MSVKSRIARGLSAQGFNWLVNVAVRVLELPIAIHYWGADRYGQWLILFAIPSILNMSDIGFVGAAKREMAMLVAGRRREAAGEVYQTVRRFTAGLSLAVAGFGAALIFGFLNPSWLGLRGEGTATYKAVIVVLLAYVAVKIQTSMLEAGWYSTGQYARGVMRLAVVRLIEFLAFAATLAIGGGIWAASLAYLIAALAGYGVLSWMVHNDVKWLSEKGGMNWALVRRLARPAVAAMGFPLGFIINIQVVRLIVGVAVGPAALTAFVAMRTLAVIGMRLSDMLSLVMEPEYAFAEGENDKLRLRRLAYGSSRAAFWGGLVVAVTLLTLGGAVLDVWSHGEIKIAYGIFGPLVLAGLVNSTWYNLMKVPFAINRHEAVSGVFLAVNVFAALACVPAAQRFGASGVAVIVLSCELALLALVVPLSLRHVDGRARDWIKALIRPPTEVGTLLRMRI